MSKPKFAFKNFRFKSKANPTIVYRTLLNPMVTRWFKRIKAFESGEKRFQSFESLDSKFKNFFKKSYSEVCEFYPQALWTIVYGYSYGKSLLVTTSRRLVTLQRKFCACQTQPWNSQSCLKQRVFNTLCSYRTEMVQKKCSLVDHWPWIRFTFISANRL